jgi:hypothetical protein
LLARLATLGLVFQSFVVEEGLLARGPNEGFVTVDALDAAIFVLGIYRDFRLMNFFPL